MAALSHLKPIFFISDLHLSVSDPATAESFASFLAGPARDAQSLYILGDLFEYWIGDEQLQDPFFAEQCRRLVELAATGVPLFFLPGNRDLLCGLRFARACGLTILPDPSVIQIESEVVLLAHGDLYCTHDRAYQRYRRVVHHPKVQWLWFHLPKWVREWQIRRMRQGSRVKTAQKPREWIDVDARAIDHALHQAGASLIIHGHTHRPARHSHAHGIRRVLPDWSDGSGGYLVRDESGWHLRWWGDAAVAQ